MYQLNEIFQQGLLTRFLRYVQIDTQSNERATTTPSTLNQWDLLTLLKSELEVLNADEVRISEHGYVTATIPSTIPEDTPVIAFFAHVDTAHECSGKNVRPLVHDHYDGKKIILPKDPAIELDPEELPYLAQKKGDTIITADGTTLLGADDKAGVAIIMTLVHFLCQHQELPHGTLKVCFNPDEEIGRGVDKLDLKAFGADFAYTLDAQEFGELCFESFSADKAVITISGNAIHPGIAKGAMINAVHLAGLLLAALPREGISPETTSGREGFIHPYQIEGGVAEARISFLLRDFELLGLSQKGERLRELCSEIGRRVPRANISCTITPQYRNMRYWLDKDMRPVAIAKAAMEQVGIAPCIKPIRGGTDGSRLTELGLPTPNLFCGFQCIHSLREWISLQDMVRSVEMLIALVSLWTDERR